MTADAGTIDEGTRSAYWQAVSDGDDYAARRVAEEALAAGAHPGSLLDLVVQGQVCVGSLWARNEWTVAREHAATAAGEAVVRLLATHVPEPVGGPLVVVACVEREWHAMPALVVAQRLRLSGLRVDHLGASVSRDQLVSHIVDHGPRAALLSASLSSTLPRVRRHVEAVRGTGTPVVLGGRAFDAAGVRARRLGATAHAADPAEIPGLLASLPRHVTAAPPLRHPSAVEARSVISIAEEVARDVSAALRKGWGLAQESLDDTPDDWRAVLTTFVPHVVDSLVGALLTEDPSVLDETRGWLQDVLVQRGSPDGTVADLWSALRERLRDHPEALGLLAT